jgi:hypothetical protein
MTNDECEHRTFNIERRIEEILNTEREGRVGFDPTLQKAIHLEDSVAATGCRPVRQHGLKPILQNLSLFRFGFFVGAAEIVQ